MDPANSDTYRIFGDTAKPRVPERASGASSRLHAASGCHRAHRGDSVGTLPASWHSDGRNSSVGGYASCSTA